MALTIAADTKITKRDKQGRIFALGNRGIKIMVVSVTFGASDNYATNGVSANIKVNGISELIAVASLGNNAAVLDRYDIANSKILMYGSNGAAPAALVELANASTVPNSKVFNYLIIGR